MDAASQMETAFFWIFAVSFSLLVFMFLLGEIADIFDHLFHGVFGAIEAAFSHDAHFEFGHLEHIDGDHDSGASPINIRTILGFLTFFGGGGLLVIKWSALWWVALPVALLSGFAAGWLIWKFTKFVYSQSGSSHVRESECIGAPAVVILGIPPGSMGEIRISIGDERMNASAKSLSSKEIPAGTQVAVLEKEGGVYIVEEVDKLLESN